MATKNEITGDSLISKTLSPEGESNYDTIFGTKKRTNGGYVPPPLPLNEYPYNGLDSEEWDEKRMDIIGSNGPTGEHY